MLVVANGIDTVGIRNLPSLLGEPLDCRKILCGKQVAPFWGQGNENIVLFAVGILQFFKG